MSERSLKTRLRGVLEGARRSAISRVDDWVAQRYYELLIEKTNNFGDMTWLERPIWQSVLDVWSIQEVISRLKPSLILETGTHRGGSSFLYGTLMDAIGHGEIITIDLAPRPDIARHPRVRYFEGSSVSPEILRRVEAAVAQAAGPVLVILDSDHSQSHVAAELEAYTPFVTKGSYALVQDGVIDVLPMFAHWRPGPLGAIRDFVATHHDFEIDRALCDRFLATHHPDGWLKRTR